METSNSSDVLKQSCSYKFLIHKKIQLAEDDKYLHILIGPGDKKYLLDGEYYTHYDLNVGQEVICRVDKINCSGQIFLEPRHPHYNVGEIYKFLVKEIKTGKDPWGNIQYSAIVVDKNSKTYSCVINSKDTIQPGITKIDCVVSKIKKGELFLMLKDYSDERSKLIIGEFYKFKVIEERMINNTEYFILKDPFGLYHKLLKEYYNHFSYRIGQIISARIIDRWPDMDYKIEPNNPSYLIGAIYSFKIIKLDLVFNALGDVNGVYQLEDNYGQQMPVAAKSWQINNPKYNPDKIKCRVINYKKGKLLLENTEEQAD